MGYRFARRPALILALLALLPDPARAYISQVDGTVVPTTTRMQQCLDRPVTGESPAGAVDALADAMTAPEAYRPVEDPVGSGQYPVTFEVLGEGAGFRNIIGYYFTDAPGDLRLLFDCRPTGGACDCPCDPDSMRNDDGDTISWRRTIDFASEPGFVPGRAIGFFIRTNEQLDMVRNTQHCGVALTDPLSTDHRTYYTSKALNDDGDFVHFLVYESQTYANAYYFGFEDLFRGGDNDFEDALLRATGLVPTCVPQLETCDGTDEDCDLIVDEGVTQACSTVCGAGVQVCAMGSYGACSAPTRATETCDGTDEDCDGRVDEALTRACTNECGVGSEICVAGAWADCSAPTPTLETCNGADDDCDSRTDESITRACSTTCGSGTEMCVAGSFVGCSATVPSGESCNGLDDDCDGRTDEGITQACMTACGSGVETCVAGSFVGCTADVPTLEICNDHDDDCDGRTDEELTRSCSSICGAGSESCSAGEWVGCDAPSPSEEVCNGLDDDCDGVVDDGDPDGGAMCLPDDMGGYTLVEEAGDDRCIPGRVRCVAGELVCRGSTSPSPEVCNCEDDDCDGVIDEDSGEGLCPGRGACVECTCLTPCSSAEFPCPPGRECDFELANPDLDVIGYCVEGRCADVECPDGQDCDPLSGECIDLCEDVSCRDGFVCVRGICVEDNCYGQGCEPGQRCFGGDCEDDPCLGVTCAEGEFCQEGECTAVCEIRCPEGETCRDNTCVPTGCEMSCPEGTSCVDGACADDVCAGGCGFLRRCVGGECIDEPCVHVECPSDTICEEGQCYLRDARPVVDPRFGFASGGGGAACAAGGEGPGLSWLLLLGLLGRSRSRSRPVSRAGSRSRSGGRPFRLAAFFLGAGALLGGCTVDPICIGNCPETEPADAGLPDARPDAMAADGCVAVGEEICNERDDDCDGLVDEGIDLSSDPRACGGCNNECVLPFAFPGCDEGRCVVDTCEIGHHDLDGNGTNGCEYECLESGDEICDLRDNDCDGATDEGFALDTDVGNCGSCGNVCAYANAGATCNAGICSQGDCRDGFVDANGSDGDGCEVACPDGAMPETCNGRDDNCNAMIDEGFALETDPLNCGGCGRVCSFAFGTPACVDGVCALAGCVAGHYDVDGLPGTGCEYACTPDGSERCDGEDNDCDGIVDETDPMAGMACGESRGDCVPGGWTCQGGGLNCVGGLGATPEVCGGGDEDCDGDIDENPGGNTIPGTGVRCGATNRGECQFGAVVCSGGALVCGGALVEATTETCNGRDDDCNGATDDGLAVPSAASVPSCAETRGVCADRTPTCRGSAGWGCDLPSTYQAVESLCDGLDNDCDGSTDEGCPTFRGTDFRLDSGDFNSVQPVVGSRGGVVYSSWMEVDGRAHIQFRRSTNSGASWMSSYRVDTAGGAAMGPRVATATGGLVSLFADFRGGTNYREIYTARSVDIGASFGANLRINPGQNTDSFNIEAAVTGNTVHIVYETFTTSRKRRIFHSVSTNGGASWSSPQQVSSFDDSAAIYDGFVETGAVVAVSGATVHVAWRDNRAGGLDIYYTRSTNGGATWEAERRLDLGTVAGSSSSFDPVIAAEGGNVYVVWVDDRSGDSFDIYMNRSTTNGASWLGAAMNLDDDPLPHDGSEPAVVATGPGEVTVAWVDLRSGFADIVARHSDSAGMSFDSVLRLDTSTAPGTSASLDLSLAADDEFVVAAWADDRAGAYDIYLNYSLDGGARWQNGDQRLDSGGAGAFDSVSPYVAADGGRADIVWVDSRSGANAQIRYSSLEVP